MKDYESRVESMQGQLMQSGTNVQSKEEELTRLQMELDMQYYNEEHIFYFFLSHWMSIYLLLHEFHLN